MTYKFLAHCAMHMAQALDKFGIKDYNDEWDWNENDISYTENEYALPAGENNNSEDIAPAKAKRKPAPLGKGRRIVVKLLRALYGHPDAGTFWEKHCDERLQQVGFNPIQNWPSCYVHNDLQLFLIVYVDDFKMSGPQQNLKEGWHLIKDIARIDIGEVTGYHDENGNPQDLLFLGCKHKKFTRTNKNGVKVTGIEYDMEEYLESCITHYKNCYKEIAKQIPTIKPAATPFLQEDQKNAPSAKPAKECPLCGHKSSNTGNPQSDTAPAECDHKHNVILPIDENNTKSTKTRNCFINKLC